MAETIICNHCGEEVSTGHKFCGNCGMLLNTEQLSSGSRGKLAVRAINDDGTDGEFFHLIQQDSTLGRDRGLLQFPHDPTISPIHAFLTWRDEMLILRDAGSRNGTFVRVTGPTRLEYGDVIQCGEQILRFDAFEPEVTRSGTDGAVFGGSLARAWRYKLTQQLSNGREGLVYCALRQRTTIGRDAEELSFPHDRFLSGEHCAIERGDKHYQLVDLSSRNGTYVKVTKPTPVAAGSTILIGRQLLRVQPI
jgi:pSer/pThr/pTyr-binding forkhead associated (FHA) protein